MGFLQDLTGDTSAKASKEAAANLNASLLNYGNQYAGAFKNLAGEYAPFQNAGGAATTQLADLLGLNGQPAATSAMGQYQASPGLAYQIQQGGNAIDQSGAARGTLQSGATLKALQANGQNLANQDYGNYLTRLMGLGQQGLGATQGAVNTTGTGLTGQFGAETQGANAIAQGDIAAAQAKQAGAGNLLNFGGSILGAGLGGMGGFAGLGKSLGGLFGGAGGGGMSTFNAGPATSSWGMGGIY